MENEKTNRFAEYIVTDLPRFAEMAGHNRAAPSWIFPGIFGGVAIRINGLEVSKMVRDPHAEPHVHEDHPEIYFAPSEHRGDVVIEVRMEDETFTVESPFAVYIPPGTRHCFTVLKCDSPHYVFGMHLTDTTTY